MIATLPDMNPNMLRRIYEEMFDDEIVNYGRLYVAEVVATELFTLYKDRRYLDVWNKINFVMMCYMTFQMRLVNEYGLNSKKVCATT